ncbi:MULTISPECIES: TetR/AcrR family transcriptional regulator [Halopseudomonas]|uniref:Transcriptional regulator, TetR family n=1 Tax=Halopseudomonas bauzanensis TaxID=653930 RepID=A0A1H9UIH4_9GAMM|nr:MULTISPECIES: TetR/AcrR family transcriptional regulator [Halopseudomonas]WGK63058.1 TetR/AcrR family transcriptional regulator [Halopseudomonas sp. SMJS2]SES09236.1 transcriptional regulator, TetR family [Halopseudomonas bauzanensis]SFM08774.1 transcriptional regulator, TetR family [Halopseudomonas bauzanensis]
MTADTTGKRYRGSATAERRALRRQQLIDAATEVYGEHGYRHSGVKQVCEAAGLTQRYFYESFNHSDELLLACYEQATRRLRERNLAAAKAAGDDPVARSRAMLGSYFQALKDEPNVARLLLVEIRGISPAVDQAIEDALRASTHDMTLALAKPGQQFDRMLQAGILGGVIHIALYWMASGYAQPVEVVTETTLKIGASLLQ